jgi:excisionase family DNA binding protein
MTLDLASRQDILVLTAKLDTVLAQLATPAASAGEPLLSVQQVADYTRFDRKTVEKWVKEGRWDTAGKRAYLPAYDFCGRLRFKRADVEAFGLGVGVLACTLPGERPEPTKAAPATKKPKKSTTPLASEAALKVA